MGSAPFGDPAELNEAELQEFVDDQVFSGWNGDTKIIEPEMEWPRLKDIYVRVGVFSKARGPISYKSIVYIADQT